MVLAFCTKAWAQTSAPPSELDQGYLASLQQLALQEKWAQNPQWLAFLQFKQHPLTRRWRSLSSDPQFLISPQGSVDPQKEMEATLAALFEPANLDNPGHHTQCRHVARFHWLVQVLHIDERLTRQPCIDFQQWRDAIDPDRVSLVFASAYLNNPSSMYGHTFLRIDAPPQRHRPEQWSYTLSYAADADPKDGFSFAYKGLMGHYHGIMASPTYFLKLREYSLIENRDVWEYPLQLTATEVERMVAYAWEMSQAKFNYYFFDENCAYMLMVLLDVARPSLKLADEFTWWAIPSDIVKAVVRSGLVSHTQYHPSEQSLLLAQSSTMSEQAIRVVQAFATGEQGLESFQTIDASERVAAMDLADRYLLYLAVKKEQPGTEVQRRLHALRLERSQWPTGDPIAVTEPAHPEAGHGSQRWRVQYGQEQGLRYAEWGYRPAYHDLLDPGMGFVEGAEIEFGDLSVRTDDQGQSRLQRFKPIGIRSMPADTRLLSNFSWQVSLAWNRVPQLREQPLVGQFNGGLGKTWNWGEKVRSTVLLEIDAWNGPGLKSGSATAWGPSWRSEFVLTERWHTEVVMSEKQFSNTLGTVQNWRISQRFSASSSSSWVWGLSGGHGSPRQSFLEWRYYQ